MTAQLDNFELVIAGIAFLSLMISGVRKLINPDSLKEDSFMYRWIARRRFGLFNKHTVETGKLTNKQIRLYGLGDIIVGLFFLVIIIISV